jgi:spoIIIJ-associated protein
MEEIERSAASVEEAIASAVLELGISEQEAQVEVLQEAKAGFLGFNAQPAIVRVRRIREPAAEQELTDDQSDVAADFLEGALDAMGISADVEINGAGDPTYVEIWGEEDSDDIALLIGKHGATLDALQELVRVEVYKASGEPCRVVVDVEDYRKRRRSQLVRRAREVAGRVSRSGRPESLEPMTPFDRKTVHEAVADMPDVETSSEGMDPHRHVVVRRR